MDANFIVGLGAQVMWIIVKLTAPVLGFGLAVGLLISIFQATTQIQEQTLAFVPKIAAVIIALLVFGPWMLATLLSFSSGILGQLNTFIQ